MSSAPRHWRPLIKLRPGDSVRRPEVVRETARWYGVSEAEANAMLDRSEADTEVWINDIYQVQVGHCGPNNKVMHLNIRRRDGGMFKDWRHFQQIKNQLAGEEREGFEIYPRESRKVDTSNKWHIFVLPEGQSLDAVGWQQRDVQYDENRNVPGLRQRPL